VAVGDIATHFFDEDGNILNIYENTLCAEIENLKNAKQTIAIASGKDKTQAIAAALHTGIIDTLITDEYTAQNILAY
jgi:DNA-binding transcriptional regulator LsrR (DeoR family)